MVKRNGPARLAAIEGMQPLLEAQRALVRKSGLSRCAGARMLVLCWEAGQ
jgi:hypothetical protein